METYRLAGIIIILGFIIFWAGNIYSPPNVYSEVDMQVRLSIVQATPARWALSQGLGVAGIGIVFIGLFLLSVRAAGSTPFWITYLPGGLNFIALILAIIWVVGYIADPLPVWQSEGFPLLIPASLLILVAGILYGILFLRTGLAPWIAYLTIGYCAIALLAIVVANPDSFWVISFYLFFLLAAAVGLMRMGSVQLSAAV